MSNDRVFIACTKCTKWVCIGKYYPGILPFHPESGVLVNFLNYHTSICVDDFGDLDLGDKELPFRIHTEGSLFKAYGPIDFNIHKSSVIEIGKWIY